LIPKYTCRRSKDKSLEVGHGAYYNAAVLSRLEEATWITRLWQLVATNSLD
jgi:protein-L-isoaspartate O-methyltransferase